MNLLGQVFDASPASPRAANQTVDASAKPRHQQLWTVQRRKQAVRLPRLLRLQLMATVVTRLFPYALVKTVSRSEDDVDDAEADTRYHRGRHRRGEAKRHETRNASPPNDKRRRAEMKRQRKEQQETGTDAETTAVAVMYQTAAGEEAGPH
eukprot:Selendium_serpulae@DN5009_c0_g2_i3.p1